MKHLMMLIAAALIYTISGCATTGATNASYINESRVSNLMIQENSTKQVSDYMKANPAPNFEPVKIEPVIIPPSNNSQPAYRSDYKPVYVPPPAPVYIPSYR